jgi:hypothetical protein
VGPGLGSPAKPESHFAPLHVKSWGHRTELVTEPSRVPPGSFNPRMDRAGLAPELLVLRDSAGKCESVSFREKSDDI